MEYKITPKDFIKTCIKNDLPGLDYNPITTRLQQNLDIMRLLHASIGMSGESGEVLDSIKKTLIYGKSLNKEHLLEECGDILWYMSIMLHQLNSSFEEVMQKNINKLEKRYPIGFTEKDAILRKDKEEK